MNAYIRNGKCVQNVGASCYGIWNEKSKVTRSKCNLKFSALFLQLFNIRILKKIVFNNKANYTDYPFKLTF